jgi:hypothetical protein
LNKFLSMIAASALSLVSLSTMAAAGGGPVSYDMELDFTGNICADQGASDSRACGNYSFISQSYGDIAGVLDVSHRSLNVGTLTQYESALKYWGAGYSDLPQVAWGGGGSSGQLSEMVFTPGAGYQVTLLGLGFGDYANRSNGSSFRVLDASTGGVLFASGTFDPGPSASIFDLSASSTKGLVLQWGPDSYDVGLGVVSLSITPVPETETWAMLLTGLGVMATVVRRRTRKA